MLLQDIVKAAKYSELHGAAIKDNDDAIITFINLGLIELYKRFPINVREVVIPLNNRQNTYDLPADCMYVLSAYDEVEEDRQFVRREIPINREDDPYSIFFPNYKQVQVPITSNNTYISLNYVAEPIRYTEKDMGKDVDVPESLLECLLNYIAYKAFGRIKTDSQSQDNIHYARFERSCKKARELGVSHPHDSIYMENRIFNRGFV